MGRAVKQWTLTFKLKFKDGVEKDTALLKLNSAIKSFDKSSGPNVKVVGHVLRRKQKRTSD